ncbi:hypothetical protein PQJ75_27770 [Rhodoplanes sp. TEM]|uniref:Uncharacterized protein n=1 Tax=Rhodoplanes tepidamans TaxID=200616 RepID=A0ABT5JEQ3_RHOTP|nr:MULTISPECIES: hypothetical protein [Rhodoplanes]MDC7788097.1 hypothetical protein [Rhodoplanes tepidamans]MDC7987550.1 hypothetical protein [Rhodoplanes sp. TEM]MDQ0355613.1 hypothetical protein [Rhodoplanes tepidamans]
MSDPQDGTRDPRLSDPRGIHNPAFADRNADPSVPGSRRSGSMWAWLAGIVAAVFIIAIVYGMTDRNANEVTMDRNAPAATTGSGATSGAAPPAGSGASNVPGAAGERSANPGAPAPAAR